MKMVVAVVMFAVLIGILDTNAETDPNDATALRVMYNSLNSPQQLIKWSANGDPCDESWKGIKCSNKRVTEIDISGLGLTGSLGYQVDKLTAVTNFDISNNNFWAVIPYTMPPNVQKLNIANNGFSGGLPYYISTLTSLRNLNVSHNQLDGQVNDMFGSLSSLSTLDFSFNSMSGDLPNSFSSLISMNNMYLQNNQFTGKINVLANLPLDNLNIENNLFNGWIPQQLKGIKNLKTDGNGNTWQSGPAPPPPPGTPPVQKPNRPHKPEDGNGSNEGSKKSGIGAGGIIGILVSVLVIGAIVAIFIMKRRSRKSSSDIEKLENQPFASLASQEAPLEMKPAQNTYTSNANTYEVPASINLKPPPIERQKSFVEEDITTKPIIPAKKVNIASIKAQSFSIADLQIATDSFNVDNLLGEGSVGRVYRAQFNDGKVFAVKKINSSAITNSDSFLETVLEISRLHHQNVTELIGYCSEHGQHLLVYEYLKSGSLNDILHLLYESKPLLTWNNRVKIALGTARAVEYLHEVCSPSVIHKNLKSENILLDSELNPHLSDSGLATLIQDVDQAGAGYSAPEVAMSGQYTIKSDVYSFGVVMLELLTGRKPFDTARARSEQSLVRWATPQLHDIDALDKMVDPMLEGLYPVKSLSRFADVIALCVQSEPEFRPPMSEVVEALVRLVQRANMSKRTVGNDQNRNESVDSPRD